MDVMSIDDPDIPGGNEFEDVTSAFEDVGRDMEAGSFVFMDGFSLQDAMGVFEIGEPRLDSGVVIGEERRPPFDPLTPLLPEEICWILDRSFAYEMEWHTGNTLSQTVFTLLFIHHLDDFNPDLIPSGSASNTDHSRPQELITLVLRSAVIGLLKCCDLAWRELSQGALCDCEDWQSEKCDISLLEGVTVKYVLMKLDDACTWLQSSPKAPMQQRDVLLARIMLRKTILELMHLNIFQDSDKFQTLISVARKQLLTISVHPSPSPGSDSLPWLAFDPVIARRLNSFAPLRVVEPPSPERTWEAIGALLDGWEELLILSRTTNVSTWETVGYLRSWMPQPLRQIPFLRASTQSVFFGGVLILNSFAPVWLVNQFFVETLDITYIALIQRIRERWIGPNPPPFADLERRLIKLMTTHIQALWYNHPRTRRHLATSTLDWHALYSMLLNITSRIGPNKHGGLDVIPHLPNAALVWRLTLIRDIIFSGFQLELYTGEEKVFAYWYATRVIETHLSCIDNMVSAVPRDSTTYEEMKFQRNFLTALQLMSMAMFASTLKSLTLSWQRLRLNFQRRYKWAFKLEYDDINMPDPGAPRYFEFIPACREILNDDMFSPADSMKLARHILLQSLDYPAGWSRRWRQVRIKFVQSLANTCANLQSLPASTTEALDFDVSALKWDPQVNPWFPSFR